MFPYVMNNVSSLGQSRTVTHLVVEENGNKLLKLVANIKNVPNR